MTTVTTVTTATIDAHLEGILALQRRNHVNVFSSEVQDREGFVFVEHTLPMLQRLAAASPQAVALHEGTVVGYCLSMLPSLHHEVPILAPMFGQFERCTIRDRPLAAHRYVVGGQVCVDRDFRGQGLLARLYDQLRVSLAPACDLCVTRRVCRHLARRGWLEGEDESAFLSESAARDDGLDAVRMSSITYRIATGRDAGRKVVTLQTLPGDAYPVDGEAGKVGGFSLHAGVAAEAHEGQKLERLCRYIARPAISERRLSISPQGRVRYALKTPWRNGTTHVEFEPVEFIAKLAALVPPPRAHLTRFHGIFAPNAALRAQLTPSGRGKGATTDASANADHRTPDERRRSMTWAQRLKRVFGIDVDTCEHCGGAAKIVASVEAPDAIRAILGHFARHAALPHAHYRPAPRASPAAA